MKNKLIAAFVAVSVVLGIGYVVADTVTNRGVAITVTKFAEGTKTEDQLYLGGAVRLTDTDATAPTTGFLTIRGTNLVFITTMKDGTLVDPDTAYVVVKAGVLAP